MGFEWLWMENKLFIERNFLITFLPGGIYSKGAGLLYLFWPGVFGIAAPILFAHFWVAGLPEASHVETDFDRTSSRCEKLNR